MSTGTVEESIEVIQRSIYNLLQPFFLLPSNINSTSSSSSSIIHPSQSTIIDPIQIERNCQSFSIQLVQSIQSILSSSSSSSSSLPPTNPSSSNSTHDHGHHHHRPCLHPNPSNKRTKRSHSPDPSSLPIPHRARSEPSSVLQPPPPPPPSSGHRSHSTPSSSLHPIHQPTNNHDPSPTPHSPPALRAHPPILPSSSDLDRTPHHDIDPDPDPISEQLSSFIHAQIDDRFDDLILQFNESLTCAKHDLVSFNQILLQSQSPNIGNNLPSKPAQPSTHPSQDPQPSSIQAGSIADKLRLQFEHHLLDYYQRYLSKFISTLQSSDWAQTPLDPNNHEHRQLSLLPIPSHLDHQPADRDHRILNAIQPNSQNQQAIQPDQIHQIINDKFEVCRQKLQLQASDHSNRLQATLVNWKKSNSDELDDIIDQIETVLLKDKDQHIKLIKRTEELERRLQRLESEVANDSSPIVRRSKILQSLGLIDSTDSNRPHPHQQQTNLSIFLDKLNDHLKISLRQIEIHDPHPLHCSSADLTPSTCHAIHPVDRDPNLEPNERVGNPALDLRRTTSIDPTGFHPLEKDSDQEFFDKLIMKLLLKINQSLRLENQDLIQFEPTHVPLEPPDPNGDSRQLEQPNSLQEQSDSKLILDHHELGEGEENPKLGTTIEHSAKSPLTDFLAQQQHHQNWKVIHFILQDFFDLNFKRFVWPRFENLVCQLESYLISQQV